MSSSDSTRGKSASEKEDKAEASGCMPVCLGCCSAAIQDKVKVNAAPSNLFQSAREKRKSADIFTFSRAPAGKGVLREVCIGELPGGLTVEDGVKLVVGSIFSDIEIRD